MSFLYSLSTEDRQFFSDFASIPLPKIVSDGGLSYLARFHNGRLFVIKSDEVLQRIWDQVQKPQEFGLEAKLEELSKKIQHGLQMGVGGRLDRETQEKVRDCYERYQYLVVRVHSERHGKEGFYETQLQQPLRFLWENEESELREKCVSGTSLEKRIARQAMALLDDFKSKLGPGKYSQSTFLKEIQKLRLTIEQVMSFHDSSPLSEFSRWLEDPATRLAPEERWVKDGWEERLTELSRQYPEKDGQTRRHRPDKRLPRDAHGKHRRRADKIA